MVRKFNSIFIAGMLAFASIVFVFTSCNGKKNENVESEGFQRLSVKSMHSEMGWGYRIYQDTTIIIEQPYVPGVPGNIGFTSEEQALETGRLVEKKIQKGILPPTVTAHELDSMRVKY